MKRDHCSWRVAAGLLISFGAAALARGGEPKFALSKGGAVYLSSLGEKAPAKIAEWPKASFAPECYAISPDGKRFVLAARTEKAAKTAEGFDPDTADEEVDMEIFLAGADGKREKVGFTGDSLCEGGQFSPDGKKVALYYTDQNTGYAAVEIYALAEKKMAKATPPKDWAFPLIGLEVMAWRPDSEAIYYCIENQDEKNWRSQVMSYDLKSGKSEKVADAPGGLPCLSGLAALGNQIAVIAAGRDAEGAGPVHLLNAGEKGGQWSSIGGPAVEEFLPMAGGGAVVVSWAGSAAYRFDAAARKLQPLGKLDLQGRSKMWRVFACQIQGAPAVVFRSSLDAKRSANLMFDLKTGKGREIFPGYEFQRLWQD